MKPQPPDVFIMDPLGFGTLRIIFEADDEDDDYGDGDGDRRACILSSAFDGATIRNASQLREIARTLEHAADWIAERPALTPKEKAVQRARQAVAAARDDLDSAEAELEHAEREARQS